MLQIKTRIRNDSLQQDITKFALLSLRCQYSQTGRLFSQHSLYRERPYFSDTQTSVQCGWATTKFLWCSTQSFLSDIRQQYFILIFIKQNLKNSTATISNGAEIRKGFWYFLEYVSWDGPIPLTHHSNSNLLPSNKAHGMSIHFPAYSIWSYSCNLIHSATKM
jgi:hypothetical protein